MSSSPSHSHSHVGSSESQVNVLDYCSQKDALLEPQKQLKTPKTKNIQLHTRSPINASDRVRHVRFLVRTPSISPEMAKTSTPSEKALRFTPADTYRNDHGYHYPGAGSPEQPPTRQAPHSFAHNFKQASGEQKADFIFLISVVKRLRDSRRQSTITVTQSTPSPDAGPDQPSTPSPVARYAPDAPVRRQGCTTPRFEAPSATTFVPQMRSPSPLSRRVLVKNGHISYSPLRHPFTPSPVAPRQPFADVRASREVRLLFPRTSSPSPSTHSPLVSQPHCHASLASTPSPLSPSTRSLLWSQPHCHSSLASTPSPLRFSVAHSPQSSESFSRVYVATPPPPAVQLAPLVLCPQDKEDRFEDWVFSLKARMASISHWIDSCHSPGSCEPAVMSPSASSVADSWSARSTSIATMSSGSPLPYRIPIVEGECNFLSALVGKRIWRFSSYTKEAYLNVLNRDDPHRLLQTPPTRTASVRNWIADLPTPEPHTPLQDQHSRLRELSSPLSPSLFSPSIVPPICVDPQAHGLPVMSPSLELVPAQQASPLSQSSSDCWSFDSRTPLGRTSPASSSGRSLSAASPSSQASPVVHSSPAPAASPLSIASRPSPITLRSLPAITRSHSPANKLPAALSNLQALLDAGSPQPAIRSPSPATPLSPVAHASSPPQTASPVVTHSLPPARPRCLKRKLPADASPAPVRSRPAVTRFEPPVASHFSPVLPDSLPSLPRPGLSMPGSVPTTLCFEPPAPVTPLTSSSGFPWKTLAGIAVGAFALGCLATRYLF